MRNIAYCSFNSRFHKFFSFHIILFLNKIFSHFYFPFFFALEKQEKSEFPFTFKLVAALLCLQLQIAYIIASTHYWKCDMCYRSSIYALPIPNNSWPRIPLHGTGTFCQPPSWPGKERHLSTRRSVPGQKGILPLFSYPLSNGHRLRDTGWLRRPGWFCHWRNLCVQQKIRTYVRCC